MFYLIDNIMTGLIPENVHYDADDDDDADNVSSDEVSYFVKC